MKNPRLLVTNRPLKDENPRALVAPTRPRVFFWECPQALVKGGAAPF